jgi:Zn-finger nucleic acid-binding protein
MRCPQCDVDLNASDLGKYGFVVVDECSKCHGIWFDKGELDKLDESIWIDVEELPMNKARGPVRTCPKCEQRLTPLAPKDAPDLVVDKCEACQGFWLDAGEFERMREVAGTEVNRVLASDRMEYAQKPKDWSHLRWSIYLIKSVFDKKP